MKARFSELLLKAPAVIRVALVLVSIVALAVGSAAPDDWGYSGWAPPSR